jgi:fibro-slime domain-containing protein
MPTFCARSGEPRHGAIIIALVLSLSVSGCASQTDGGASAADGGGGANGRSSVVASGGSISIDTRVGSSAGTAASNSAGNAATPWPPSGYINVTNTSVGAYALGPNISDGSVPAPNTCAGLFGVVRDFKMGNHTGGHPDFETMPSLLDTGIVQATLGDDGKPVYANPGGTTNSTTGQANFDQWYRDVPDVNMTFMLGLELGTMGGLPTFSAAKNNGGGLSDSAFFPLDGQGWGNEGESHNFSFTTEIHTSFKYNGGEIFTFKGDDDVWVFINNQLVIDLGGRHGQMNGSVNVDTLGLTPGSQYDLAVFHAERHTSESNFQLQTTLAFTNCGQINGVDVLL